ncbi:hypothetical protein BaRGS_00019493 [Batillaria attramentaria]|uniref:Uncharacterized protein n=1 Tax=Batillaria attramentaria TaxID=370345 RepID=A0ABD0KQA3_9CAEN
MGCKERPIPLPHTPTPPPPSDLWGPRLIRLNDTARNSEALETRGKGERGGSVSGNGGKPGGGGGTSRLPVDSQIGVARSVQVYPQGEKWFGHCRAIERVRGIFLWGASVTIKRWLVQ